MKVFTPLLSLLFLFTGLNAQQRVESQNTYVNLGQKAVMDGNFKLAVTHLEKSLSSEANNAHVLYMLAYSYYHSGEYAKAVSTFGQVLSLRPNEVSAYYYRGKARNVLGAQMSSSLTALEREKLLLAAIKDFSKAIELNPEDTKLYQNRAIAYRDYGILKGQKVPKVYDKNAAANAYRASMSDLQRLLDINPGRKDVLDEMKKARVYLSNLDN
ncbi:tetratricopeptide repeat protein [Pedobacter sp. SYSU D00535]|uniref:tetratricopeptide repeat protein n=1 Tax=Pedobacter sp. SYSU D00535 TaxID=2810308 RepID=UPI001A974C39|nr:tetratricopeptide repeat protein [Pedobacter sp. SYSU D00535]